jgi:hypothetical protein
VSKLIQPIFAVAVLGALALVARPAAAETHAAAESAAAEALFQQAAALMQEGKFRDACEKFEGSQELEPALGTQLRLADCYDRAGRTASAWSTFQDVISLAHSRGEPEREQMAAVRVKDLESRLSRIKFKLGSQRTLEGLSVRLNRTVIPAATWDVALPVDPGPQRLEVTAPGKVSWSTSVDVAAGPSIKVVNLPDLADQPRAANETGTPGAPARLADSHDDAAPPGRGQRTLGYVTGAVGLVSLGVGGFLAYRAKSRYDDSLEHCRADDASKCTAQGVAERDSARHLANGGTATLVAGGALVAGGLLLVLLAPHHEPSSSRSALQVSAGVSQVGASMGLTGRW